MVETWFPFKLKRPSIRDRGRSHISTSCRLSLGLSVTGGNGSPRSRLEACLTGQLYLGEIRISNCSRLPLAGWDLVWSDRSRLNLGRVRCGGDAFHLRSPLDHAGGSERRMIRKSQEQEEWRSGRGREVSLRKATDCGLDL